MTSHGINQIIGIQNHHGHGQPKPEKSAAAQAWRQAQPASREANRYVLQILLALNRITETTEPLKNEVKLAPQVERPQAITSLPRFFARVGDKKLAASVLEQALADELKAPATGAAAWTAVGRMRLAAGELPGALEAAERGQALDPAAEGPTLLALELMDPKLPRAEALVQKYLEGNPKAAPEIRMAYARVLAEGRVRPETVEDLWEMQKNRVDLPVGLNDALARTAAMMPGISDTSPGCPFVEKRSAASPSTPSAAAHPFASRRKRTTPSRSTCSRSSIE